MSDEAPDTIAGRVVAFDAPDRLWIDANGGLLSVSVDAIDVQPGDLVRVVGRRVEWVFRPASDAWAASTEPTVFVQNGLRDRLRARSEIQRAVRAWFDANGFLEIETPSIAVSPGLDVHLHGFDVRDASGAHEGHLITSPEYHMKRLLVGGVPRCFQFARCFRAGERGSRHEPEFTMLEWYRVWGDMDAMTDDTFAVLCEAAKAAERDEAIEVRGQRVRLDDGYETLTVREAFEEFAPEAGDPIMLAERDEAEYFRVLSEKIEPRLGLDRPMFLTHFPARHASLAKLDADDPSVCERFELYVGGLELSNGFVELTDPVEQRARFERDQRERAARKLPVYPIDERFLAALALGMPPSVGNALGFDRLVMLALGAESIADVVAFPSARR